MGEGNQVSDSSVRKIVRRILDHAVDGVRPMSGAAALARKYELNRSYASDDARVDALIRWEASKNFTSGFLTSLGGALTLPVTVPASLGASWLLQARLSGAIAVLYGHGLHEERVRTLILLSLVGDSAKEIVKDVGIVVGKRVTLAAIERLPAKALGELNKTVGFRLLTKAGENGAVSLSKAVPFLGGLVGGSFDAAMCVAVGKTGKRIFRPGAELVP
jgi:hypothetical protein